MDPSKPIVTVGPAEPVSPGGLYSTLLRAPERLVREGDGRSAIKLFIGAAVSAAFYGASAGFFAGGTQIVLATLKGLLILVMTAGLCAPSLLVFLSLGGVELTAAEFTRVIASFCALVGVMLLGFIPISWLFSVSSASLLFVVLLHALIWAIVLVFSTRLLLRVVGPGHRGTILGWSLMFCLVSFQVATYVRPVLWRAPGAPLFESGKKFFTDQLGSVSAFDDAQNAGKKR